MTIDTDHAQGAGEGRQAHPASTLGPDAIAELMLRYDRPAPRYTSYPTALDFAPLSGRDAETRLRAADSRFEEPLSLYVHLPFCDERCWFCGCHVVISPDKTRAMPYLDEVRKELDLVCAQLPRRRTLGQLHFGGGTPTYYDPETLQRIAADILKRFPAAPGAELAVEVDPRVTRVEHLEALASVGFNRVSFGVQDLEPRVQESIGRIQSPESVAALVQAAVGLGFAGINADLIYGLPHQTPESIGRTADMVVGMGVQRVALYSFAYLPQGRGHQKQITPEDLPTGAPKLRLFAEARARFMAAGFETIGMDHFAAPDDELSIAKRERRLRRNFQGYTVLPSTDVVGLGISAIGDLDGALLQNEKKLNRYAEVLARGELPTVRGAVRSRDDQLRGRIISELMCNFGLDFERYRADTGVDPRQAFAAELSALEEHVERGLVELDAGGIELTPLGQLLVRNVATVFDAYRQTPTEGDSPPRFSRAI